MLLISSSVTSARAGGVSTARQITAVSSNENSFINRFIGFSSQQRFRDRRMNYGVTVLRVRIERTGSGSTTDSSIVLDKLAFLPGERVVKRLDKCIGFDKAAREFFPGSEDLCLLHLVESLLF